VDFSGAIDGGKYIWIAEGRRQGDTFVIEGCERAALRWGSRLEQCLEGLAAEIAASGPSAYGLDFPFSVPEVILEGSTWYEFVSTFASRFATPEEFREKCWHAANNRELRRFTDFEAKTPFCVYNLRIYRQTYYGIRDILGPLVTSGSAYAPPMQDVAEGKPWLLEICPASILRREGLNFPYKGSTRAHALGREKIIESFESNGLLVIPQAIRTRLLLDRGGDSLDSVIAALATAETLEEPTLLRCESSQPYANEGRVFVPSTGRSKLADELRSSVKSGVLHVRYRRKMGAQNVNVTSEVIMNALSLTAADVTRRRVSCPGCGEFIFARWPDGWDGHAGWRCAGLASHTVEERKREFKERFGFLFYS
jgi:hypothetical protein